MAIDMLFFLITAAAHWHARRHHAQQADAARQAANHLRTAYRTAASAPLNALQHRGRLLPRHEQRRQAATVHEAIPELAERILTEPGWPALAATLNDAEAAGHPPTTLLAAVAAHRELDTADSISDVLTWRLRRTAALPTTGRLNRHRPAVSPETGRPATRQQQNDKTSRTTR